MTEHFDKPIVFITLEDKEDFEAVEYSDAAREEAAHVGEWLYIGTTTHDMTVVAVSWEEPIDSSHEIQEARLHARTIEGPLLYLVGNFGPGPYDDYYLGHANYLTITDVFDNKEQAEAQLAKYRDNSKYLPEKYLVVVFQQTPSGS